MDRKVLYLNWTSGSNAIYDMVGDRQNELVSSSAYYTYSMLLHLTTWLRSFADTFTDSFP